MAAVLRTTLFTASIVCFGVALLGRAHAQSSCLAETAKEILSKAGVPTNEVQLLLLTLTPDSTADASVDQVTQLFGVDPRLVYCVCRSFVVDRRSLIDQAPIETQNTP